MRRLAGGLCAFLGIILLVSGFVASFYEEKFSFNGVVVVHYPYIHLAIPLIVPGVVLIIAGGILYFYTPEETPSSRYFGTS